MITINKFITYYSIGTGETVDLNLMAVVINNIFEKYNGKIFAITVFDDKHFHEAIVFSKAKVTMEEASQYLRNELDSIY